MDAGRSDPRNSMRKAAGERIVAVLAGNSFFLKVCGPGLHRRDWRLEIGRHVHEELLVVVGDPHTREICFAINGFRGGGGQIWLAVGCAREIWSGVSLPLRQR